MPVSKPTQLPRWATAVGALVTEPSEAKKDAGWIAEPVPADWWNWIWNRTYLWLLWLQDIANQSFVWTGAHDFSGATFIGPAPAWTVISSFGSGMGAVGGNVPKCTKDANGIVRLEGLAAKASATSVGDTVCTLPSGFRPSKELRMVTNASINNDATFSAMPIKISTGGVVTLQLATTFSSGQNDFSLDGLTFPTNS